MRTGAWIAGALKPKNDPTNESGTEMKSHKLNKATKVPNGTAADEPFAQSMEFVIKKMENKILNANIKNTTK